MANYDEAVNQQYATRDLQTLVVEGLRARGLDVNALRGQDISMLDQFHTGGRGATLELAELAKLRQGETVLDVGGGMGGPARIVAEQFGCEVTVLDITRDFVQVGELLTAGMQLEKQVHFEIGNALEMPFEDRRFDVAWSQHSLMNISDKRQLYGEIRRVLRGGGRYALHEFFAGDIQPIHFPVPWARTQELSFLETPENARGRLSATGFRQLDWIDETDKATAWFRERAAAARAGDLPPFGLHVLMGRIYATAIGNLYQNLEEGRLKVVCGVFEKV